MVIKGKTERRLRCILISITIICLAPLCERGRTLQGAHANAAFAGKDITCVIDLENEMYGGYGLETGLNYELLSKFAKDNKCNINIVAAEKDTDYIDSLRKGKVDIVIAHSEQLAAHKGIEISKKVNQHSAWAVSDDMADELRQINIWISYIRESEDYGKMIRRYSGTSHPSKLAERGIRLKEISPYDKLLKRYAAELGWDWRMLAAVVYQESRFSINTKSHRGAQGLMQVMPATAKSYNIEDLLNPENNLKAGVSHLKRLQRMFSKYDIEQTELIKFTLAAYNAGEGRISDCRNFAESKCVDNTKWDEIVKLIPLMREDSILEEESVKLGKFQGYETIAYIEKIMSLYRNFCEICPA
jgi:membrane-bound lytic murein transglycosylase F